MGKGLKSSTCLVIGSGIAGLAAAIRLSSMGMHVKLFEANSTLGGKIAEKKLAGYRFDIGPSVLTKPDYIMELFLIHGKNPDNYIQFEKLDRLFNFYFPDGTTINSFADPARMEQEIREKSDEPVGNVSRVLNDSKKIYRVTREVFLERSLHKTKNYFNWPTLRGVLQFNRVRAFQTMHSYNSKRLNDKRLVQIFDRYASYIGSNPFEAPATLNIINHFEINEGAYFPVGGMYKIVEALVKLAGECGVEIFSGVAVKEIIVEGKKVKGIQTSDGFKESACVICNADIHLAYEKLLPGKIKPEFILSQPRSSSVIVFLWGINKKFPQIGLHNTCFGENDREEYDAIFNRKTISEDPTVYFYNSSSNYSADAPQGKSNLFAMISAPYEDGQNWEDLVSLARTVVIKKLSTLVGEDIGKLIEVEEVLNPKTIESHTGSWKGSVYGNSSNGMFSAFLRHPNFSKRIEGLYFCGGSVHPGSGIPLCLLSAKIAADLIKGDFKL